jgi:hypothetical protein
MARRRYRNYNNRSNNAAVIHVQKYNALSNRLGPVVDEMKKAFFDLLDEDFNRLIVRYRSNYGASAAEYATEALPNWKSGRTKMSGQTMERLINLVPKYLTYDQRYNMVSRLCKHHRKIKHQTIRVNIDKPEEGLKEFEAGLESFYASATLMNLPDHVIETLTWINDDDVIVARALLAQVEKVEADEVREIAKKNREEIRRLITNQGISNFRENIIFPNGKLTIYSYKDSFCVIATTVYGSSNHPQVVKLRIFRNKHLTTNRLGRKITSFYYDNGYILASLIGKYGLTKSITKHILSIFILFYGLISND